MNWKVGLFRMWIVFAVIVAAGTMLAWWSDIEREFDRAKGIDMLPVDCKDVRGDDYFRIEDPPSPTPVGNAATWSSKHCLYKISAFRAAFPEYAGMSDQVLSDRLHEKLGLPKPVLNDAAPWKMLGHAIFSALLVPALVLAFGSSAYWALAGFRKAS